LSAAATFSKPKSTVRSESVMAPFAVSSPIVADCG
jgi:hypothetical protein